MKALLLLPVLATGAIVFSQNPPKPSQPASEYKIKKDTLKSTLVSVGFETRELGSGV